MGVCWQKNRKKWHAHFIHHAKTYYGGLFDHEEDAAMQINLICDDIGIKRKNPEINEDAIQNETKFKIYQCATENIVNETVKIEDKNILDGFNPKRKRKQHSMINQDVKEVKEEKELLEQIQNNYTKIHD